MLPITLMMQKYTSWRELKIFVTYVVMWNIYQHMRHRHCQKDIDQGWSKALEGPF